jgi:hypothetical protein
MHKKHNARVQRHQGRGLQAATLTSTQPLDHRNLAKSHSCDITRANISQRGGWAGQPPRAAASQGPSRWKAARAEVWLWPHSSLSGDPKPKMPHVTLAG